MSSGVVKRTRGSLVGAAMVGAMVTLSSCSSGSTGVEAATSSSRPDDGSTAEPVRRAHPLLEQAIDATVRSEGAAFTEEWMIQDAGGTWRLACRGSIAWRPEETARWTCQIDAATAKSQIDAALASGPIGEVVARSISEVRIVESKLYQKSGVPNAETVRADLPAAADLCLSTASYCTAPGRVIDYLRTAGFVTTPTPSGLRGSLVSTHAQSQAATEYTLTIDNADRIRTISIETLMSTEGSTGRVAYTLTFEQYGPQQRVLAPAN